MSKESKSSRTYKNLVIVESPSKARTIEKYLGSDYKVTSSLGHIRDLPKNELGIDVDAAFKPTYIVSPDKKKTVSELRKLAKSSDTVLLATDEDREGEAIAWHLAEALGLKPANTKRIVFHEITKNAILRAIENPRDLDKHLVDAQQARRVLDRLVGYQLSPVLWKKVQRGLSAGRVQSVAVRIIVEREREIEAFKHESSYRVLAEFDLEDGKILKAELKEKLQTIDEVVEFFESIKDENFTIEDIQKKPTKKTPAAPFTTSTLQQEAARKLGFSVKQTMVVAQKLYESGKITYMRTDSLNLSEEAIAKAANEINSSFGEKYHNARRYKTKDASAQEAHEAIRPTNFAASTISGDSGQQKLYELIWKRTVASQMADAQIEKTTATISISNNEKKFGAYGEVIKFDGFLKLYMESSDDENEDEGGKKMLPPINKGQNLPLLELNGIESFKRPPARYNEAALVKKLEEMGIGRPSTYAPTISTIQAREYVVKEDRPGYERKVQLVKLEEGKVVKDEKTEIAGAERAKLFPTDTGMVVNDFLVKFFPEIVDYKFTAKVEEEFDEISKGNKDWSKMLASFYKGFSKTLEDSENITRKEASQSRDIGIDPKSGKMITARIGRYGPMLQIGDVEDEEKPKFAPIPKDKRIETITLGEALKMFELPREVGYSPDGYKVVTQIGRFGPYVKCHNTFASITQEEIFSIDLDEAMEKIKAKEKAQAEKLIKEFPDEGVKIQNGKYGPYITYQRKNHKIPKDLVPQDLTLEECMSIIGGTAEKKSAPKKKATKTTTKSKTKTSKSKSSTTKKKPSSKSS